MKGTTGLDFQNTWFFSSKNLMKVSLTCFAGHSRLDVASAPGIAVEEEGRDLAAEEEEATAQKGLRRVRSELQTSGGFVKLRLQRGTSARGTAPKNPLLIHSCLNNANA